MFFTTFLISSIISHGFLDFFILSQNINFTFYYVFGFLVYDIFLKINITFFTLIFILLSGYHFGKDFQIITSNYDGTQIWNGFVTISSTIICENGLEAWFKFLTFLDVEPENIYMIFRFMEILFVFSFISTLLLSNIKIISFNVLRLLIIISLSVETTILYHMLLIHVPLAIYQFKKEYGITPVIFWLIITTLLAFILEIQGLYVNKNDIMVSFSVTISHMITISLWQLF